MQERKKSVVIKLKPETGLQVHWWILNLRALRQKGKIKDPKSHLPARAIDLNGDAAGGDTKSNVKGGRCAV